MRRRFADYDSVMQWPGRIGLETRVIQRGRCSDWMPTNAGEVVVVLALYKDVTIDIWHFNGTGGNVDVKAVGRVGNGTEGIINLGFWHDSTAHPLQAAAQS